MKTLEEKDPWACCKCNKIKLQIKAQEDQTKILTATPNKENNYIEAFEALIEKNKGIDVNARSTVEKHVLRQSLMDLPYFDGNHKVWPRFKQTFIQTTKEGNFSDLENLNRLQKSLKGDALKAVNSVLLDSSNVDAIMQKLEDLFGSVESIYSGLLQDVMSSRNPKFDLPKTMVDFISAIGNLVTNMKCLNHEEYLNDPRLVRDLSRKLPTNLHQQWLRHVNEDKELSTSLNPFVAPSLEDFYEWLKPQEKLATMLLAENTNRFENTQSEKNG